LLGASGDDIEVAVQNDARDSRRVARTHLGDENRQPVVVVLLHFDVAGFEPTLDESCGGHKVFRPRGVIRDKPLSQDTLVDHGLDAMR
jgi:hypothetical protein